MLALRRRDGVVAGKRWEGPDPSDVNMLTIGHPTIDCKLQAGRLFVAFLHCSIPGPRIVPSTFNKKKKKKRLVPAHSGTAEVRICTRVSLTTDL